MTIERAALEARHAELLQELEAGQRRMAELEEERARLHQQMLRIAGAAQVLEELLRTKPGGA